MALVGLVPALLCDDPSRAFVIGWGLGVTAGELGTLDDVKEVVAAEISPAVLEAAPFFDAGNQNASKNPKIQQIRSDAYRALLRSEGQFGVIASEPSNPWVMGVEMLFSEEFLRAARDRLTPGGVFAQWFHLYEVDDETVKIVLRTYKAVFGDMAIWFTLGPDVLLLGFKDPSPALDIDRLRERFERADFRAGFERAAVGSWIQLLAHEVVPLGAVAATELPGPLHTVRHPILSDSAARAFFAGGRVPVPRMPSEAASQAAARHSLLEARARWERAERGCPGGAHPPRLCDGAAHRVHGPAGALDGQPSGLAAAGRRLRRDLRASDYRRRELRAPSRPRPSRHWWSSTADTR